MAATKNALTRYMILDELLSDRMHEYSMSDLWERTNDALVRKEMDEVSKRCIEKDMQCIEYAPFFKELEKHVTEGKMRYRYAKKHDRIFRQELKEEERILLAECLNTLGQFEGLAHFEWIEGFCRGLNLEKRPKIISFSNNPYLQGSNLLGELFDDIANQVVIRLTYHTFLDDKKKEIILHPYLLKQYNERWFLIAAADEDNKILTFALDRIDDVTPLPSHKFRKCKKDLYERYDDIIGITYYEGHPVEHITFWVDGWQANYVQTKPLHGSQKPIKGEQEQQLLAQYPHFTGGKFFSIDCIPNYELIRELCSFGSELVVLSPKSIQDDVYERISQMKEIYDKVRT